MGSIVFRTIRRAALGVAIAAAAALAITPAAQALPVDVNHAPTATGSTVVAPKNTTTSVPLTGADVDGDAINYIIGTFPTHGTIGGAGRNLTYTPSTSYTGADAFTFLTNDGHLSSGAATVHLVVGDQAPIANSQSVTTGQDTPVHITLTASDPDGDALTYTVLSGPFHGSTSVTSGSSGTYTPASGYHGPDSITFQVSDGTLTSNVATVSITVLPAAPVNRAPVATSKSISTLKNTAVTVQLQGTDPEGDALNASVLTQPSHGAIVVTGDSALYTPTTGYTGPDSFTFAVNDGHLQSALGTISITVTAPAVPVNLAPTANGQSLQTVCFHSLHITLAGSDPEHAALTYSVGTPSHGTLTGTAPALTYRPYPGFRGLDSFTFTVSDGTQSSAPATVSIVVRGFHHRPVAYGQSVTTGAQHPVLIHLNGWSGDRGDLDYVIVDNPDHGRLVQHGADVLYIPARLFHGQDSFRFIFRHGGQRSRPAAVTLDVRSSWSDPRL
jgi:hypothetical protein